MLRSLLRAAAGLLLALGLLSHTTAAPAALVSTQVQALGNDTVEGELRSYFPENLSRGWAPVQVDLTNRGPELRKVTISITSDYSNSMARSRQAAAIDLAPGQSEEVELYVPCDRSGGGQSYSMKLDVDGLSTRHHLGLNQQGMPPAGRVICLVRGTAITASEKVGAETSLPTAKSVDILGLGGGLDWGANTWAHSGRVTMQGASLFHLEPSQFPGRTMGWSSVDTMICDTSAGLDRTRSWKHVADWVRMGGQVVFIGKDAGRVARTLPGIEDLFDERFRVASVAADVDLFQAAYGLVSVNPLVERLPKLTTDWGHLLVPLDRALPDGLDEPGRDRSPNVLGSMYRDVNPWKTPLEKRALPVRSVLALLILFAIAIGPFTVVYTRRKRRPDLMFLIVPVLSVLSSVVLLAYGIGREGFSIKGNAHSMAFLDQRTDGLSTSVLRRELFMGRGGYALEPKPGTVVLVQDEGRQDVVRTIAYDGASVRLGGAFLPAREQSEHLIARVAPARVRVEVKPTSGGGLEVTNGLGVDIEGFELQTPDGRWMKAPGAIPSGSSAVLTAASGPSLGDDLRSTGDPMFALAAAPAGGFLAVVSSGVIVDDCAVPMEELSGRHAVVGILSDDAKGWTR